MQVRELPPLRLHILATAPNGHTFRWGDDERRPENMPSGIGFSTIMPGGNETLECELPRKTELDYSDLRRLTTLTLMGPSGRIVAEGRLERAPRATGDTLSVSPQAVGWQAHLADDQGASVVYVDRDLSHWGNVSSARRQTLLALFSLVSDPNVDTDITSGFPALQLSVDATGGAVGIFSGAWYDAGAGNAIGSIYYDYTSLNTLSTYAAVIGMASTDTAVATDVTADLLTGSNSSGSGTQTSTAGYRFGLAEMNALGITPTEATHLMTLRQLQVFGNHGLTKQGTAPTQGYLASDVVAHAISTWAPRLRYTTGPSGTIAPTSFAIPQLEFRERTTSDEIIKAADRFHIRDWAVWEGPQPNQPTFYYQDRGARGRRWRARVRPSQLQETGPQVDKLFNGVYVKFTDAGGTSLTVGPTGSSADTTSAQLIDTDPLNPANQVGIKRHTTLDMGIVSTAAAATEVGRRFLEESKAHDKSGSAELVGHVEDDRGVVHPTWAVRAGDEISFTDASDTSYRRIVKTSYEHDSRTTSVDLDSPPEGMDSLLERLGVAITAPPATPAPTKGLFGYYG